jgi:hypothetical protein
MNEPNAGQPNPQSFELIEQVGTVEMDRYCSGCGYNLRQQAIRRETATQLLLCKCPECGLFEPANTLTTATRGWFRTLIVIVWGIWFVIWLNLIGWSVFGVTGMAVVSGDIRRSWVQVENIDPNQLVENEALEDYRNSLAQNNSNNPNAAVNSYYYGNNVWDLRPMRNEDGLILAIFLALTAAIGAVMTTITVVAMPHWPRWGYVVFACAWPLVGIFIFHGLVWRELYQWRMITFDLMQWHLVCAVSIEAIAIAASLLAVWLGRPVTRGLVRMIVPPKRRGMFAYLWLADSKTPPKTV